MRASTILAFLFGLLFAQSCQYRDYSKQYTYWDISRKEREGEERGHTKGYREGYDDGARKGKRDRDREWQDMLLGAFAKSSKPLSFEIDTPFTAAIRIEEIVWKGR